MRIRLKMIRNPCALGQILNILKELTCKYVESITGHILIGDFIIIYGLSGFESLFSSLALVETHYFPGYGSLRNNP